MFFSEEKNQKTFTLRCTAAAPVSPAPRAARGKSLFASFSSEKEESYFSSAGSVRWTVEDEINGFQNS